MQLRSKIQHSILPDRTTVEVPRCHSLRLAGLVLAPGRSRRPDELLLGQSAALLG
jgi:hypothetical protein